MYILGTVQVREPGYPPFSDMSAELRAQVGMAPAYEGAAHGCQSTPVTQAGTGSRGLYASSSAHAVT
jgi:hypothetical protein